MIKVTFIESNGTEHAVEGASGQSLMQVAADNLIPGVTAECGGFLNCATCHVYIDEAWFSGLPAVEEEERRMGSEGSAAERGVLWKGEGPR